MLGIPHGSAAAAGFRLRLRLTVNIRTFKPADGDAVMLCDAELHPEPQVKFFVRHIRAYEPYLVEFAGQLHERSGTQFTVLAGILGLVFIHDLGCKEESTHWIRFESRRCEPADGLLDCTRRDVVGCSDIHESHGLNSSLIMGLMVLLDQPET